MPEQRPTEEPKVRMPEHDQGELPVRVRRFVTASALVVGLVFSTGVLGVAFYHAIQGNAFSKVVGEHFIGVFGPPLATVASMVVVLAFRFAAGPMEFKVLNVEFKGSSGPVVLWCFSFLLQILGLSVLWPLK